MTRRLTFCQWLWVQLIWSSLKAPPRQTEGIITTEPSCPSLLSAQGWVRWPNCLSEPQSLSFIFFPPGRCTSLLWLNRLSRDPINHHLHSRPVRSPFTTATSSDMYTLLFKHALHALLRRHLPFILHHLISQHTDSHTHTHTQTSLDCIPQAPHQGRPDSYYSQRFPILLPFLSLSAGQSGLQQPAGPIWTWMNKGSRDNTPPPPRRWSNGVSTVEEGGERLSISYILKTEGLVDWRSPADQV